METLNSLIKAQAIHNKMIEWRRDFHKNPELGFSEIRTAGIVAEHLRKLGFRVKTNIGKTGVVAELGNGDPMIAIRADMDALPLTEKNKVSYASQKPSIMHACGHDAHTAILMGVAELLILEEFHGSVRLLFQPSEESADEEGISGAPRMVEDGAMEGVNMILALHVGPMTPTGQIRVEAGPASGGVDSWFGKIIGKGGHGAYPHKTIDPFYICSHVIMALNGIVSRKVPPFSPAVVSIGSIHGGHTENVIPEHIDLTGTLRYTDHSVHKDLHKEIQRAFRLAKTLGGDFELRFEDGGPPMINDPAAVRIITDAATRVIGRKNVLPMAKDLGAEDFGYFSNIAPGAMFMLGALIEGDERVGHNPFFDIDENALPIGTAILLESALGFLKGN
ncbi:MAG TPA: M20 family metallopeptidase [Anaerolineales bacterium]|nr:M20 family metallopeptidase [Anaerolineales bacterium]